MNFLVTGGAGYVGSHMVKHLLDLNNNVTILDNFSTGHRSFVQGCEVLEIDLLDFHSLNKNIIKNKYDCIFHFAAKSLVFESQVNPNLYYEQNIVGALNLLKIMHDKNIPNIVFSSSAAIFGNPIHETIDEDHPINPINTYGRTKFIIEEMLKDACRSYGINACSLRYFNAAGADEYACIGEKRNPETHLIPNILKSAIDKSYKLKIYGNDYKTRDGTCIRDYIHVNDLASAHVKAYKHINLKKGYSAFNLGNGSGFSILEIIRACEEVIGKNIKFDFCKKRDGDPPVLVANSKKAIDVLEWEIQYPQIIKIIETAWKWHQRPDTNE